MEANRDASVLRGATLGDVEVAHDLQAADHAELHLLRDLRDRASDAVDPRADDHVVFLGLEVDVRGTVLDRLGERGVDELDRRGVVARLGDVLALRDRVEQELDCIVGALDDFDLRAVEPLDRPLEVGRLRDREPYVVAEREPEVVGAADIARVGDGHEQQVVVEEPHGHRLVASRELLGEQHRGVEVEVGLRQVDVLEPVLVGQRLGEVLGRNPVVTDDDLAESLARERLFLERLLDLVHGQQAAIDQQ